MGDRERPFTRIQILKDDESELGTGSYGSVYKAKCDDLLCAAKVLHRAFFRNRDPGARDVLRRFQQECQFLSRIRHPHIVQYLGVWRDPESNLPILLMELLDESLTSFLERRATLPLPYHVQINITHDVAMALAYLHSKNIVHRDLSSNNVLLIAGQRAKVTDFGMCKLLDAQSVRRTLTHCPGTDVYMPPEAVRQPPTYTNKIDCFSFGPLAIQVVTRKFPNPSARTHVVDDPQSPTGTAEHPVLEEERRSAHISLIDGAHGLLPIIKECLKYNCADRPTAAQLCTRIGQLREEQRYKDSSTSKGGDVQPGGTKLQFDWIETTHAPCPMASGSATAIDKVVYVQPWGSSKVYSFHSEVTRWAELPDCQKRECSLVVIKGEVTAVGGCTDTEDFNTLSSLEVRQHGRSRWVNKLRNMPTKRYSTAAVSNQDVLIVAGGFANGRLLSSVEIMDIETEQWYTAPKLPCTLHRHSAALCGNNVFMLGGKDSSGSTKSVFQSSLNLLLLRAAASVHGSSTDVDSHWKRLPSLPLNFMTPLSVRNNLIALGGFCPEKQQRSTDIHVYDRDSNSWVHIGAMTSPRSSCISAALSHGQILVVGGKDRSGLQCNTVEMSVV